MITKEKIKAVKVELSRFKKALANLEGEEDKYTFMIGNKNTGALKRASMDLSRSLANLRKSGEQ